jgi:sugar/nucleoside kinase (ribokinase family)
MTQLSKKERQKPMIDCIGLGIIPYDLLFSIDTYPPAGQKIDATGFTPQGGGPVPTAMIGLAKLGCRTAMIASVGDDPFGELSISELTDAGVDASHMVIKKQPSALACGLIEPSSGRRTMVLARSIDLKPTDIKLSRLPATKIVHLDGRDLAACMKLARWAKRTGALVSFDIGSMRNDVSPILALVDHLVVAHDWAFGFTQTKIAARAIDRLRRYCSGTIVVTEGINGSYGAEPGGAIIRQRAYRVNAVDTTGAGDAFHTGYLFGLLGGEPLDQRMKLGAAAAACKCRLPGARAGLPTATQLKRFLSRRQRLYA